MVHSFDANEIKQVEFNTIASSFGGISTELQPLHRYKIMHVNEFIIIFFLFYLALNNTQSTNL